MIKRNIKEYHDLYQERKLLGKGKYGNIFFIIVIIGLVYLIVLNEDPNVLRVCKKVSLYGLCEKDRL